VTFAAPLYPRVTSYTIDSPRPPPLCVSANPAPNGVLPPVGGELEEDGVAHTCGGVGAGLGEAGRTRSARGRSGSPTWRRKAMSLGWSAAESEMASEDSRNQSASIACFESKCEWTVDGERLSSVRSSAPILS
jgi:hypothetical protein